MKTFKLTKEEVKEFFKIIDKQFRSRIDSLPYFPIRDECGTVGFICIHNYEAFWEDGDQTQHTARGAYTFIQNYIQFQEETK